MEQDIYDVFVQSAITPKLSLQSEYRRSEREQGDLQLNFDPDFSRDERREIEQDTARLGVRFSPKPQSDLIISGIYTDRHESLSTFVDIRDDKEGYQLEVEYLFQRDWFNAIIGGGSYRVDFNQRADLGGFMLKRDVREKHDNAYLYLNVTLPTTITWTLGLSYDAIDIPTHDLEKLNPKAGMQWSLTDWIRLRLAYFQTLKRPLVLDQTVEPTQIAGFNQFFDDIDGTKTERYGVGLDAILTDDLYGGVEYSRRDLKPRTSVSQRGIIEIIEYNRREELYRSYLYWTPQPHWALSAEAQFEQFKRSSIDPFVTLGGQPTKVETVLLPLAIRYFNPSGFFVGLGGTFVHQEVDLAPTSTFALDSDDFFLLDASIGYRLPKRRGIISLQARNLFDEEFLFQDLSIQTVREDDRNPSFIPDRAIFLQATLAFN